jgi:hypothetical protein
MATHQAKVENRVVIETAEDLAPVKVKVTKRGDGKISTGVHNAAMGDELYEQGETFSIAKNIADELEDRGFVMILDEEETETRRGPGRPPKAAE